MFMTSNCSHETVPNLAAPYQKLPGSSHYTRQSMILGDNFRVMAVLLENICFAPDECLRLLRWQGNARSLQSLEAGGRRVAAKGVGGRWHSHAEMEFTIFQRGSGIRYIGDFVGSFGEWDCVLLGSHLPHCWMEQDRTDGYVLQFHLPNEHPLRSLGGEREVQRLFATADRGISFRPATARAAIVLLDGMAAASKLARRPVTGTPRTSSRRFDGAGGHSQPDPCLCRSRSRHTPASRQRCAMGARTIHRAAHARRSRETQRYESRHLLPSVSKIHRQDLCHLPHRRPPCLRASVAHSNPPKHHRNSLRQRLRQPNAVQRGLSRKV